MEFPHKRWSLLVAILTFVNAVTQLVYCFQTKVLPTRLVSQQAERSRDNVRRHASSPDFPYNSIASTLTKMGKFYEDMVDVDRGRFYAKCFPPSGERAHEHNPIRDLAASWDASKVLLLPSLPTGDPYRNPTALKDAILGTLKSYPSEDRGNCVLLTDLKEQSSIGHSAMYLLALTGAMRLSLLDNGESLLSANGLVSGILSMQRFDGAFGIRFDSDMNDEANILQGIDFYPGEAMVALMDIYEFSGTTAQHVLEEETRKSILLALKGAFVFYSDYYERHDLAVNYNIWQVQAFSRLFQELRSESHDEKLVETLANHVVKLCDDVLASKTWKYDLARGSSFYTNIETVEVACGLDALADGFKVARIIQDDDMLARLSRQISNAVYFLEWAQSQVPEDASKGFGGLGYQGITVMEQRLDVTGHAISALSKLYKMEAV